MSEGDLSVTLAVLRVVRGWNQHELARAAGVRINSVSEYERGKKLPELKTLERLVTAMGYPLGAVDSTRRFVRTLRTESVFAGLGSSWEESLVGESRSGEPPADWAELDPAALQWEIEQVSADAGRVASRLTRLVFLMIGRAGATVSSAGTSEQPP